MSDKNLFYENCEYKNRYSFIYDDDFRGKRFSRYVEKTKSYIFENYAKKYYLKIISDFKIVNLNDFVIKIFHLYYAYLKNNFFENDENESNNKSIESEGILRAFHKYTLIDFDLGIDRRNLLEKFLTYPYLKKGMKGFSLNYFIDEEIKNACADFIRKKSLSNKNLDKSNYFLTLPDSDIDAIYIFEDVINRVNVDVSRFIRSEITSWYNEASRDEVLKGLHEELDEEKDYTCELEEELKKKNKECLILKEKLGKIEIIEEEKRRIINDDYWSLEKQHLKLKEKYNNLLSKYSTLKDTAKIDSQNEQAELQFIDVDVNKRYLFIAYDDITFKDNILNVFKNSFFSDKNFNIDSNSVDIVIVLTTHIDHSTYYSVKEQCKTKNIPFLHSSFNNVDLIKELIWNYINL